ncbi:unnamed protein product [Boreogadus saida]
MRSVLLARKSAQRHKVLDIVVTETEEDVRVCHTRAQEGGRRRPGVDPSPLVPRQLRGGRLSSRPECRAIDRALMSSHLPVPRPAAALPDQCPRSPRRALRGTPPPLRNAATS